jgi:hypothetical protein
VNASIEGSNPSFSASKRLQGRTDDVTVMAGQLVDVVREVRGVRQCSPHGASRWQRTVVDLPWVVAEEPHVASRERPSVGASLTCDKDLKSQPPYVATLSSARRGGRAVECGGLENH